MTKAQTAAPTRDEMLAQLRRENAYASSATVVIYLDAMLEYRDAQSKIEQLGPVMMKGGAPMENPYLKVRDRASATLLKCRIKTKLWET